MSFVPRRVAFDENQLRAYGLFRSRTIRFSDITRIEIKPVLSLADEIGVTVSAGQSIFFTDADRWFRKAARVMNFAKIFGADWYERVEQGETLMFEGHAGTGVTAR